MQLNLTGSELVHIKCLLNEDLKAMDRMEHQPVYYQAIKDKANKILDKIDVAESNE